MKTKTYRRRRPASRLTRQRRRGAAAVEFAICANIFFILIFTCMEFARMNMIRNLAQDAAYFAARSAMVPGATSAEAEAVAHEVMGMMTTTGYEVNVDPLDANSPAVVVTVTVDFDQIALFAPMFLPNATIESTAVIKTERYDGYFEQ
ncbi:MAG: pilus assembly protein [Planctomycetales bacterium]|nr:pilus assembly protein [Planctomycetales bacterium]